MSFLNKLNPIPFIKKSYAAVSSIPQYMHQIFRNNSVRKSNTINSLEALQFWRDVSTIGIAIDKITEEFANITPYLKEKKNNEIIKSNPVLDLLEKPNTDITREEFMTSLCSYYKMSGNVYIIGTVGSNGKEFLELFVVNPTEIRPNNLRAGNIVDEYIYQTESGTFSFKAKEDAKLGLRYISENGNSIRELWSIKTFNPFSKYEGLSPLENIYYEIKQHLESSVHNYSLLKKGGKISGLAMVESMTDTQYTRFKEQMNQSIQGAENAGGIMLIGGQGLKDFKNMTATMQDMDFSTLKRNNELTIYAKLKVPFELVLPESSTYNNKEQAMQWFYTNTILPLTKRLYSELTKFLLPRFGIKTKEFMIFYDENEIPVLQTLKTDMIEKKSKTGIYTINELRAMNNLNELEGGNVLYQPLNLVPLGSNPVIDNNQKNKTKKEQFARIMSKQLDENGNPLYNNNFIEAVWNKEKEYHNV
jgi:HK97 family phage portal protein